MLRLLHLCDSLFPTGAYAHSDGLEYAAASGHLKSGADLEAWLEAALSESIGRCEAAAVFQSVTAVRNGRWDELRDLDAELFAMRPSSAARGASRSMGRRLLRTWLLAYPPATEVRSALDALPHATLPIAFGAACALSGVAPRAAVEAFAYTRLAATVSAAMRLMPLGQHEAHARLSALLADVPAIAAEAERRVLAGERPGMFAPGLDLAAMNQQYVHSRLFLS
jgi:urease accessory protein